MAHFAHQAIRTVVDLAPDPIRAMQAPGSRRCCPGMSWRPRARCGAPRSPRRGAAATRCWPLGPCDRAAEHRRCDLPWTRAPPQRRRALLDLSAAVTPAAVRGIGASYVAAESALLQLVTLQLVDAAVLFKKAPDCRSRGELRIEQRPSGCQVVGGVE